MDTGHSYLSSLPRNESKNEQTRDEARFGTEQMSEVATLDS